MSKEEEFAVRVDNVSKIYRLWRTPKERLFFSLRKWLQVLWPRLKDEQCEQLTSYSEFYALKAISFAIPKGESWGFIGLNGSGKSTLLKIISGNLRPSTGRVEVDGKVAILDYGSGFNGNFTGRENIFIKASLLGLTKKQIYERYDSIVEFADIGDFINQPVKTYSSGMSARLGFAIMAHVDADIIITDEALAVGDIFFVQKCMRFIRTFLENGTFLFVSHSINDVLSLCQNAVWLEKGTIRAMGAASAVTRSYLDEGILSLGNALSPEESKAQNLPIIVENIKTAASIEQPLLSQLMDYQAPKMTTDAKKKYSNDCYGRNKIQVSSFTISNEGIGVGGATILDVILCDEEKSTFSMIEGGEIVKLAIKILAKCDLQSPIVGFQVMNSLGQVIFADNSYCLTQVQPVLVKEGTLFAAEFRFQMPFLPIGQYTVRVAVALGEEEGSAVFLQVIDNAILFHSVVSSAAEGLIGIPMYSIKFDCESYVEDGVYT